MEIVFQWAYYCFPYQGTKLPEVSLAETLVFIHHVGYPEDSYCT